jgi:hypothetical protein
MQSGLKTAAWTFIIDDVQLSFLPGIQIQRRVTAAVARVRRRQ